MCLGIIYANFSQTIFIMKHLLVVLTFLSSAFPLTAQNENCQVAEAYFKQNNFKEAIQEFTKCSEHIELTSEEVETIGISYYYLGDYEKANSKFIKCITLDTQNVTAYNNLGLSYFGLAVDDSKALNEYLNKALINFNKAIELDSTDWYYYLNRGRVYQKLNDNKKSIENFNTSLNIKEFHLTYYYRASSYYELQEDSKALEDMDKAIALNPEEADNYFFRAEIFIALNRKKEAKEDRKKAKQLENAVEYSKKKHLANPDRIE